MQQDRLEQDSDIKPSEADMNESENFSTQIKKTHTIDTSSDSGLFIEGNLKE